MIPLLTRAQRILEGLNRDERTSIMREGPHNTIRFQTPLSLEKIDQPNLQATQWTTRNNPYVQVYQKRANSRKQIYIQMEPTERPKVWVAQGTYFSKNDDIPNEADPITIEQRGNILRIQQSKRARYRHEGNRQRRDTKAKRYKQLLKFINLTYGNYSEVQEVVQAWQHSPNLSTFVEAIAINEAVDRMYGTQSKLKRDFIYKPLKVGGTPLELRSLWKLSR